MVLDPPAPRQQIAQCLALPLQETELTFALRSFFMMLHRFDAHLDPRQRAIIHVRAHAVQHPRELFGPFQQRVDRDDHVGEQLPLRRGDALHDLENCLPVVACQADGVDMAAELVGLGRPQRAPRTPERLLGIRCGRAVEHIAPRIPVLPELHVLREQAKAPPNSRREQRPAETVAHDQIDEHQSAADGRPRDETVAKLRDHLRLTTRREIGLGIPLDRPHRAPALRRATAARQPGRRQAPAQTGLAARRGAAARATRRPVGRRAARFQCAPQCVGGRPASLRLLLERAHDAGGEIVGTGGRLVLEVWCLLGDLFEQQPRNRRRRERQLSGEHLVPHDTQTVDVGPPVDLAIAGRLLGTHVVRRADRDAGGGQRARPRRRGERLGDAEVGEDRSAAAPLQQDVVGFDVAMDDAEGVPGAQCVRRFHHDAPGFLWWQSLAAFEARRERFTIHIRHDEVHESVGTFADGMNRHDVRVREAGRRFRLPQEAHADLLTEGQLGREHLDCHRPLEPLIAGVIDDAHAAAADLPVEREGGPQGLTQPLRQRIVHAVLQSIRALRFSRNHPALQHSLGASCWQSRAALAALFGTDLPPAAFFRGMDAAFTVPNRWPRNLLSENPCQTG